MTTFKECDGSQNCELCPKGTATERKACIKLCSVELWANSIISQVCEDQR